MKSRTANGIYVIVIVTAIFLMLPFFVPYEDEEYSRAKAAGGYSLEDEKEPDTFMRIIDRVGSFYGVKRKRKTTSAPESAAAAKEILPDGKIRESNLGAQLGPAAKNGSTVRKNIDTQADKTGRSYQTVQYGQAPYGGAATGAQQVKNNVPDSVEYKGKTYKIEPDAYGNKYIITDKGPVAVSSALKNGGRLVNSYDRNSEPYYSASGLASYGNNGSYKDGRQPANSGVRKSGSANISRYKTGKTSGFGNGTSGGGAKGGSDRKFVGSSGGNTAGNFDFDSGKDFENIQNTISANIGSGKSHTSRSGSSAEEQSSKPKAYVLQDATPSVGSNPIGISAEEKKENFTLSFSDLNSGDWDAAEDNKQQEEKITVKLSDNYIKAQGIMLQNSGARALMTKELLNNKTYSADTGREIIRNPWIMPNDIKGGPGASFYNTNMQALSDSEITKMKWDESDVYYNNMRKGIQQTSGGSSVSVAIIDGQKNAYTMTTMPHDTFYYKTTSGLLSNRIVDADSNGTVDLNKIDKKNVLVVVPERNLADNLKKDGYKVALFEKYAVTPDRLKYFYGQTADAVKDIMQARRQDYESKKKNIAQSLSDIKQQ